jgi:DNA-binding XRE family transcriptional regulator
LADYIRRMRTKRGLSQKSLAEQAGIHLQSVGKLERGKTAKLNHKTQNGLAYALQIPAEYLEAVWRGVSIQSSPSIKFCPHCWTPGTAPEPIWTDYRAKYCFLCGTLSAIGVVNAPNQLFHSIIASVHIAALLTNLDISDLFY